MKFYPPSWLTAIPKDLSGLGSIGDFVLRGKQDVEASNPAILISADDEKDVKTPKQLAEDVENLAAALARDLAWAAPASASAGNSSVIALLSENTLDYLTCSWAIHRLRATCLLLHGSSSPAENGKHLKVSGCNVIITSSALLESATAALAAAGVSDARVYLTTPLAAGGEGNGTRRELKTIASLFQVGKSLDRLPPLETQAEVAYLCPTSGTSGIQKLACLTHTAVIANILQLVELEQITRRRDTEVVLGVMPLSHVQGIVSSHTSVYMRDRFILHTKFDMTQAMKSIQVHRINRLYLVPSVLAAMIGNPFLFKLFDLSSVDTLYIGAGNVSPELHAKTKALQPGWSIVTGYGMTECPAAIAMSSPHEYVPGAVGVLLASYQARLVRAADGSEVQSFDEPGELVVSSPNQAIGYLGDEEGTAATFRDGWLHTGDVALFRKSPNGDSHLCIVDRLRDMIKVKGLQVSPVAIEECIKKHQAVAEVAVIGVPDELAGERPKAFIVPTKKPPTELGAVEPVDQEMLFDELDDHLEATLTEPHWVRGKYEILDVLPRTPSGKISKGVLRARS
ncbi:AMP dependent ligase/synthetase [Apiospora kogelbergensis]|uniref:AMP dependent ligase/synthetase n=1 Tax=Apiospora kogelbergensis TaxID=1337665 RepID=UPI00313250E7